MTRRPHFSLRVGDVDVTVGYERRGDNYAVYTMFDGRPPANDHQKVFGNIHDAHKEWCDRLDAATETAKNTLPFEVETPAKSIRIEEYADTPME